MNLHSKFGSTIETDDSTHTHQGSMKIYCSHNKAPWGENRRSPRLIQIWLERGGNGDGVQIFMVTRDEARLRITTKGLKFPLITKEGISRLSYPGFLRCGKRGRGKNRA